MTRKSRVRTSVKRGKSRKSVPQGGCRSKTAGLSQRGDSGQPDRRVRRGQVAREMKGLTFESNLPSASSQRSGLKVKTSEPVQPNLFSSSAPPVSKADWRRRSQTCVPFGTCLPSSSVSCRAVSRGA